MKNILFLQNISYVKLFNDDLLTFYSWANDHTVRKNSFSPELISQDEHRSWFCEKLNNPNFLYVLEKYDQPVGQIRFDLEKNITKIGYLIDSNFRGLGLGEKIIELGIKQLVRDKSSNLIFQAEVKPENIASKRYLEKPVLLK